MLACCTAVEGYLWCVIMPVEAIFSFREKPELDQNGSKNIPLTSTLDAVFTAVSRRILVQMTSNHVIPS